MPPRDEVVIRSAATRGERPCPAQVLSDKKRVHAGLLGVNKPVPLARSEFDEGSQRRAEVGGTVSQVALRLNERLIWQPSVVLDHDDTWLKS